MIIIGARTLATPDTAYRICSVTNCQSVFSCGGGSLFEKEGMLGFAGYVLVPVSENLAYVRGLGRKGGSSVQILSVPPDGHEELQLLGMRYRKKANL